MYTDKKKQKSHLNNFEIIVREISKKKYKEKKILEELYSDYLKKLTEEQKKKIIPILLSYEFDTTKEELKFLNCYRLQAVIECMSSDITMRIIERMAADYNLDIILLKGKAYNNRYYGKIIRRFSDIDILIRYEDLPIVEEVLNKNGYIKEISAGVFSEVYEVSYKPKGNSGYQIDVHWGLIQPDIFHIDYDDIWNSKVNVFGQNFYYMCRELDVLHLALHAFKDGDFGNFELIDLDFILSEDELNWKFLIEISKKWRATIVLYVFFKKYDCVVGNRIPRWVYEEIEPSIIKNWLINIVMRYVKIRKGMQKTIINRIKQLIYIALFSNDLRSIVRYIKRYFNMWREKQK